jgi:hypothetical protein
MKIVISFGREEGRWRTGVELFLKPVVLAMYYSAFFWEGGREMEDGG